MSGCNSSKRGHRGDSARRRECPVHGDGSASVRPSLPAKPTSNLPPAPTSGSPAESSFAPEPVDEGERPHPLLLVMQDSGYSSDDDPDVEGASLHYREACYTTPAGCHYFFSQEYGVGEYDDHGDDGEYLYSVKFVWRVDDYEGNNLMTKRGDDVGYALDDLIYERTPQAADETAGRLAGSHGDRSAELPVGIDSLGDEMAFDRLLLEREAKALGVSAEGMKILEEDFMRGDADGYDEGLLATQRILNPASEQ